MPLLHPAVGALARVVVLVDLDVDEANWRLRVLPANPVDHVDDRPADAALAIARCRERDDERLMRSRCAAMPDPVEPVSSGAPCGHPCSRASASGTDTRAHRPSATQIASA